MKITEKAWIEYIGKMSAIGKKAEDMMRDYIEKHGTEDRYALIQYAAALIDKYGEANGSLACQMYEKTADAQGALVDPAEMAELPEFPEIAKNVNGALKQSEKQVPRAVTRMIKQVGADTTLRNAARDGAEFAWVPHGDTCAFCITLASRGWQRISRKAMKNGHAEHIHANCDCQYTIRFDGKSTVEGYNPQEYLDLYNAAPGSSPQEKISALRKQMEAKNKKIRIGAPSDEELRERIKEGKNNPENKGIIAEKILNGEYDLEYKHQKYLQHLKGTVQYDQAVEERGREQSYLTISEEEAQKIACKYAGTGVLRSVEFPTVEFATIEKPIGYVFKKGKWIETDRAQIIHSKRGVHIVPVANIEEIT